MKNRRRQVSGFIRGMVEEGGMVLTWWKFLFIFSCVLGATVWYMGTELFYRLSWLTMQEHIHPAVQAAIGGALCCFIPMLTAGFLSTYVLHKFVGVRWLRRQWENLTGKEFTSDRVETTLREFAAMVPTEGSEAVRVALGRFRYLHESAELLGRRPRHENFADYFPQKR